jgi:sulfur carrier protein
MEIVVNGQPRAIPPDFTARQLVDAMGLQGRRIAMEVNRAIVPRSTYAEHVLQDGDRIEIVQAVGGG